MSVEKIIEQAVGKDPEGLRKTVFEELNNRVGEAIKTTREDISEQFSDLIEMKHEEDEDEDKEKDKEDKDKEED